MFRSADYQQSMALLVALRVFAGGDPRELFIPFTILLHLVPPPLSNLSIYLIHYALIIYRYQTCDQPFIANPIFRIYLNRDRIFRILRIYLEIHLIVLQTLLTTMWSKLVMTFAKARLRVKRFARRSRGPKVLAPIITPDILPVIFTFLPPRDLARCLRVSQLCYEAAGPVLYSSGTGVEAGRHQVIRAGSWPFAHYDRCHNSAHSDPFVGLVPPRVSARSSSPPDPSSADIPYLPPPSSFQPSLTKLQLLRYVQHLTCDYKPSGYRPALPSHLDLLPSLHTLTIRPSYPSRSNIDWDDPLFLQIRPRHIRLTHLVWAGDAVKYLLADSALASAVRKVTLQFTHPLVIGPYPMPANESPLSADCSRDLAISVSWPASMEELDIVFMMPDSGLILRHANPISREPFKRNLPPLLAESRLTCVVEGIARLAADAFATGAKVRIVGLGAAANFLPAGQAWPQSRARLACIPGVEAAQERLEESFPHQLRAAYRRALVKRGLGLLEAGVRADEMELVRMDRYLAERGNLPF